MITPTIVSSIAVMDDHDQNNAINAYNSIHSKRPGPEFFQHQTFKEQIDRHEYKKEEPPITIEINRNSRYDIKTYCHNASGRDAWTFSQYGPTAIHWQGQ